MDGDIAILVGGAGDLGRGITCALSKAGATVVVLDLDTSTAEPGVDAISCDVTDQARCETVVADIASRGRITTLVNLAQHYVTDTAVLDLTAEDMRRSFEIGPISAMRMMQLCHPHMKAAGGGSIINFASGSGTTGVPRQAAYCSAKEAMRGLTKAAALEWGRDNIRVNAVCPVATHDRSKAWIPMMEQASPLGRVGDPETDIGAVVVFLAGPGQFITSRTIHVDGGMGTYR
jgi:NAD(P)-dependent dehydrogenase (short-subunit alcohol dehydrogenase family)